MSPKVHLLAFVLAIAALLPAMAHVVAHLPTFCAHPLPYGDTINPDAPAQRDVSNMVTAVNFDYHSFDTLGE